MPSMHQTQLYLVSYRDCICQNENIFLEALLLDIKRKAMDIAFNLVTSILISIKDFLLHYNRNLLVRKLKDNEILVYSFQSYR